MSAIVYGASCEPGGSLMLDLPGIGPILTPEPTHTGCSGGHTRPGLLGGWSCPCQCHLAAPLDREDRR